MTSYDSLELTAGDFRSDKKCGAVAARALRK